VVFVETERARRRPAEEYFRILRPADGAIAKVSAKNAALLARHRASALTGDAATAARRGGRARPAASRDQVAAAVARRTAGGVELLARSRHAALHAAALAGAAAAARGRRGADSAPSRDRVAAAIARRPARDVLIRAGLGDARPRGWRAAHAGHASAPARLARRAHAAPASDQVAARIGKDRKLHRPLPLRVRRELDTVLLQSICLGFDIGPTL